MSPEGESILIPKILRSVMSHSAVSGKKPGKLNFSVLAFQF